MSVGLIQISFDLHGYLFILGTGILFGNPGLIPDEIKFPLEKAFVFENRSQFQFKIRRKRPTMFGFGCF